MITFVALLCFWNQNLAAVVWVVCNTVQQETCWPVTLTGYAMRGNKSGGYASGHWEPELSHALFKGPPQGTAALMVSMRMYLIAGLRSVHLASRHLWHPASWQHTWLRLLAAYSREKHWDVSFSVRNCGEIKVLRKEQYSVSPWSTYF